jgi:hypothetical protein
MAKREICHMNLLIWEYVNDLHQRRRQKGMSFEEYFENRFLQFYNKKKITPQRTDIFK